MSDRLKAKQSRAQLVVAVASGLIAIPSLVWIVMALWKGTLTTWITFAAVCAIPFVFWGVERLSEDKYDRMLREVDEEIERDRNHK